MTDTILGGNIENAKNLWVISGNIIENWETGIKQGIWGVRKGLEKFWNKISKGDILIFYVTSPVSGVIGFGRVTTKFKQDKPLWPDEVQSNKLIYPFRFEFKVEYCLPRESWETKKIPIRDLKVGYRAGINPLKNKESIGALVQRMDETWGVSFKETPSFKIREEPEEYKVDLHKKIKDIIYDIGRIEGYISEKEYPMDSERLDVVWRKIERSVPTYAFEVQIGGDIYHALAKLKHAFDLWNSNLYLVIRDEDRPKVEELLSGTFHEIKNKVKIIFTDKIEELYELQMRDKSLKRELGLLI
ncbi:MAG: EVE domain-containing protein [Candidatus Thermoplasmatota archaeon]